MSRQRELVETIAVELWTIGKVELVDDLFRLEFVDHGARGGFTPDRDGYRALVAAAQRELVDVVMTVEQFVANGDWIAFRWRLRAHDTASFLDDPLDGGEWDATGQDMLRLRGDRIAERWSEGDLDGFVGRLAGD